TLFRSPRFSCSKGQGRFRSRSGYSRDLGAWSGRYKVRRRTDQLQTPRSPASPTSPCRDGNRPAATRSRSTTRVAARSSANRPDCRQHLAQRPPIDRPPDTDANRADLDLDRRLLLKRRQLAPAASDRDRHKARWHASVPALRDLRPRGLATPEKQQTWTDVVSPRHRRHACIRRKTLRDNRRLRIRRPAPTPARPGDDLDTLQRVGAVFEDRRMPILIAILTTILRHCDLATNHSARSS